MLLEVKQIWDFCHSIRVGAGLPKAEGRDLGYGIKSWLELGTNCSLFYCSFLTIKELLARNTNL